MEGGTIAPSYLQQLLSLPHRNSVHFLCLCLAACEPEHSAHEIEVSESVLMWAGDPDCTHTCLPS